MIANMEEDHGSIQSVESGGGRRSIVVFGFDRANARDYMVLVVRKGDKFYDITTLNDLGKRVVRR